MYGITPYGRTLEGVLKDLREWGVKHCERARNDGPKKSRARVSAKPGKMMELG